jgi:hypothetical protein
MNTNTDNIEKLIRNYFKLINPHRYDEVDINLNSIEPAGIIFMNIHCEDKNDKIKYFGRRGRDLTVIERLTEEMENMFPYSFKIYCKW